MKRVLIYCICLLPILLSSQSSEKVYRQYDTQKYFYEYLPNTSTGSGSELGTSFGLFENKKAVERQVADRVKEVSVEPIKVNLVFHVLSDIEGSDIQRLVAQQIESLNRDFNRKSRATSHPNDPLGSFLRLASNPNIEFSVAEIEDSKGEGKGIAVFKNGGRDWREYDDMKYTDRGGSEAIDSDKYINIWVVDLPTSMNSYATSPYLQDERSGIVIDQRFFSTSDKGDHAYIEGKTLTHLMGNYLGLHDLWNEYERCADDYVDDTPIHNSANKGQPRYKHITTCVRDKVTPEMTMNFMDSTDDSYLMMFTEGQVRRMRAMIELVRPEIIVTSSENAGE